MNENAIECFIRVQKEKLSVEAVELINDEGVLERQRRLGRLEALSESIAFAITCRRQEGRAVAPTEAQ